MSLYNNQNMFLDGFDMEGGKKNGGTTICNVVIGIILIILALVLFHRAYMFEGWVGKLVLLLIGVFVLCYGCYLLGIGSCN